MMGNKALVNTISLVSLLLGCGPADDELFKSSQSERGDVIAIDATYPSSDAGLSINPDVVGQDRTTTDVVGEVDSAIQDVIGQDYQFGCADDGYVYPECNPIGKDAAEDVVVDDADAVATIDAADKPDAVTEASSCVPLADCNVPSDCGCLKDWMKGYGCNDVDFIVRCVQNRCTFDPGYCLCDRNNPNNPCTETHMKSVCTDVGGYLCDQPGLIDACCSVSP